MESRLAATNRAPRQLYIRYNFARATNNDETSKMAKSIRSKIKKKFRSIRRAEIYKPVEDRRADKAGRALKRSLSMQKVGGKSFDVLKQAMSISGTASGTLKAAAAAASAKDEEYDSDVDDDGLDDYGACWGWVCADHSGHGARERGSERASERERESERARENENQPRPPLTKTPTGNPKLKRFNFKTGKKVDPAAVKPLPTREEELLAGKLRGEKKRRGRTSFRSMDVEDNFGGSVSSRTRGRSRESGEFWPAAGFGFGFGFGQHREGRKRSRVLSRRELELKLRLQAQTYTQTPPPSLSPLPSLSPQVPAGARGAADCTATRARTRATTTTTTPARGRAGWTSPSRQARASRRRSAAERRARG